MKLNFWQWIGLVLLLIGVALWIYKKTRPADAKVEVQTLLSPLHPPAAVPPVG
jgi:hypothetical protein